MFCSFKSFIVYFTTKCTNKNNIFLLQRCFWPMHSYWYAQFHHTLAPYKDIRVFAPFQC